MSSPGLFNFAADSATAVTVKAINFHSRAIFDSLHFVYLCFISLNLATLAAVAVNNALRIGSALEIEKPKNVNTMSAGSN